jgi:hypothetical protein
VKKNKRKAYRLRNDIDVIKDIDLDGFCRELAEKLYSFHSLGKAFNEDECAENRLKKRLAETKVLRNELCKLRDKLPTDSEVGISSDSSSVESGREEVVTHPFDQPHPLPVSTTQKMAKKNRMGQRLRRKISEQTFGSSAHHLSKDSVSGGLPKVKVHIHSSHPSWEAARKTRKETSAIDKFCGSRTLFSDSD